MKRLSVAISSVALVLTLGACSGTSVSVPPIPSNITVPSVAIPSNLASAATSQLCTTGGAVNLKALAGDLEKVVGNTDTTALAPRVAALAVSLQSLQVDAAAQSAKTAATTAVTDLQAALNDPSKKESAAKAGAAAIRQLDTAICK